MHCPAKMDFFRVLAHCAYSVLLVVLTWSTPLPRFSPEMVLTVQSHDKFWHSGAGGVW